MGFIHHVKEEFQIIQERDPSIKSPWEVLLYPSFKVTVQSAGPGTGRHQCIAAGKFRIMQSYH